MSAPPTPAEYEALFARLADRGLSFAQIAALTDRQIASVLSHPRDERGAVRQAAEPPAAATAKEEDRLALIAAAALGVPPADLQAQWSRKYPGESLFPEG